MKKQIIAIDFDGTIVEDAYPKIGTLMSGAKEVITELKNRGDYIIIWTCRTGDHLIQAINYLVHHNIPFDAVNSHNQENISIYGSYPSKIYADYYIDDKCIGGFPGWKLVEANLLHGYSIQFYIGDKIIPEFG